MKVIWSKESLERLLDIKDFIASDNILIAEEFVDLLISKAVSVGENPRIGRIVPEFADSQIREIIIKGYRLVYRIDTDRIEIVTVFEGHRLIRKGEIYKS